MDESTSVPILIVDDGLDNLLVLEAVLRRPGHKIVEAKSGLEALKKVEQEEFAVIVLDVMMPGMDGHQTASLIRLLPNAKLTPIIFITAGMNELELVKTGYESGAVDYIFKPFEPDILRSKISVFADLYWYRKENEKQTENLRLREEKDHYSFLENAMDAVVAMDQLGIVIYWNHQAEKIFGWSRSEAMGTSMSSLIVPPRYRIPHERGLRQYLETGKGPILNKRIEIQAIRKDGSEIPIELAITPIKSNEKITFSVFLRDISERLREKENLHQAIHARDEFISLCSHELKTPLTSMKIHFQLAKKLSDKDDPRAFEHEAVKKRISLANKQIARMGRLIENMLDVSRISSGTLDLNKTSVNIPKLIADIVESFQDQMELAKIDLQIINKGPSAFMVTLDVNRMEQVIGNLISNAIKYGERRPILIEIDKRRDQMVLSFTDQGLGIDIKNYERIFERYERAINPSEISGLGLGLYISKQIIEAHDGRLVVSSQIGRGSTFTIEVPISSVSADISL
jgi:PAS domain S-box-containing protein